MPTANHQQSNHKHKMNAYIVTGKQQHCQSEVTASVAKPINDCYINALLNDENKAIIIVDKELIKNRRNCFIMIGEDIVYDNDEDEEEDGCCEFPTPDNDPDYLPGDDCLFLGI